MALGKQAKILTKKQIDQLIWYVATLRHPLRNEVIVMLSVKAGLRAKEIACLTWSMVTDADGDEYSAYGEAHAGDNGVENIVRMSDTRAFKRAVSRATGVGTVAIEELQNDL